MNQDYVNRNRDHNASLVSNETFSIINFADSPMLPENHGLTESETESVVQISMYRRQCQQSNKMRSMHFDAGK